MSDVALNRCPNPAYLLGAMLDDGVSPELAVRLAEGYEEARESLNVEQTHKWLMAMTQRLGSGHGQTALAVLAYPSEHCAPRYERLACENGWKDHDVADTAQ